MDRFIGYRLVLTTALIVLGGNAHATSVALSTLAEANTGGTSIFRSNVWSAYQFTAGSAGTIEKVILDVDEGSGNGFTQLNSSWSFIRIYQDNGSDQPGTAITTGTQTDSGTAVIPYASNDGDVAEFSGATITLPSAGTYWIAFTANAGANVDYLETTSSSSTGLAGWSTSFNRASGDGTSFSSFFNIGDTAMYSITLSSGITVSPTSGVSTDESGATDTFTVVLDTQPTADVSIGISSNDTTEGTVSPSSLTFTNLNWSTPQTVTVTGVDDDLDDGDVAFSVVTAAASSGDGNYNGLNPSDVSASNSDDDTANISVSAVSGNTAETGTSATLTLVLDTEPTADVSVGISSSDATEGTVSPSALTFTNGNWSTPQTVTVTGVDDDLDDGSVLYSVVTAAASSGDSNYNGLDPADAAVTNADDDSAGITVSTISGDVAEDGSSASFAVVLNTEPTADVTIGLSSSDTTEGTVSPSSLTFTASDWDSNQTVTVTGVDDDAVDGDVSFTIVTAAATSADGNYSGLNPNDVNVTNTDDDVAETGTDSNNDGIEDGDATGIGLQADDEDADTDGDGISDVDEVGDPNNPTDSDGDGIIDALEPNENSQDNFVLAAFVTTDTASALSLDELGGSVIRITSTGAGTLTAHPNGNRGIPLYGESDLSVADGDYDYPFGLVDYSVTAPGGTASIVVALPDGVTIADNASVRKLGADNTWVTIESTIDRDTNSFTVELEDNDSLDHNADTGIIRDPIGIAIPLNEDTDDTVRTSGSGGCTVQPAQGGDYGLILVLASLLLGHRLRVSRARTLSQKV